jgi:hypothetical protein
MKANSHCEKFFKVMRPSPTEQREKDAYAGNDSSVPREVEGSVTASGDSRTDRDHDLLTRQLLRKLDIRYNDSDRLLSNPTS